MCANNYLGLSDQPAIVETARKSWVIGVTVFRRCGHLRNASDTKELERKISEFLGTEDTILTQAALTRTAVFLKPLLGERTP